MKKLYKRMIPAFVAAFIVLMASFGGGDDSDYPVGAPPGYTNSPSDGQNCSHCMGGTATPIADWIASDVPVTGYVPGTTYNIVVTATGTGNKGFELSPQNTAGNLLGTLIAGTDSKLVGEGKYITHSLASEENIKSWSFQWTAPVTGVGTITFYACAIVGELTTKTTTMVVPQSSVGIQDQTILPFEIYPNPVVDRLILSFSTDNTEMVLIEVLALSGKTRSLLFQGSCSGGEHSMAFPIGLDPGLYLLKVQSQERYQIRKFIVQ